MDSRGKARRIAFFNHKGGVGKTTLSANVAFSIAAIGKKVLVVDADPQSNLTSYLLPPEVVDDLLEHSDGEDGRTIWSALKPLVDADGDIKAVDPYEIDGVDDGAVFLIPGDVRLSDFETELNDFWGQCSLLKRKGFRGMSAISRLVNRTADDVDADFVFFDTGPNIGPLNRAILLDCDYFIVPVACDLFSLRALKTLGASLAVWIKHWNTLSKLAPDDTCLLPGKPLFLGYIPQRFKLRAGKVMRAQAFFVNRIQKGVQENIVSIMKSIDPCLASGPVADFKLGEVKDYGVLVTDSQAEGRSIVNTTSGSKSHRDNASKTFSGIAEAIIKKTA